MSLFLVVGGQFGSEGKGKIAAVIAERDDVDIAIRCGGPNSGHSFVGINGVPSLVRQLPTAFINPRTRLLIPAGAVVDLKVLKREIDALEIPAHRLGVDHNAMIIEEFDKKSELDQKLGERLSSTLCGVGAAAARRILRSTDVRLARDAARTEPWLLRLLTDVSREANHALDQGKKVLVEGTQGFGLSLFHSRFYPKATSKDTSAAAFLSEVGISPLRVTEVIMVLRTFPIRVAGAQAGPLHDEITWDALQAASGSPYPITELTTVSKKERRVGRFDWDLAKKARDINRPTQIAINCIDHIDFANRAVSRREHLTNSAQDFLLRLEAELATPIGYFGTGPSLAHVFTGHRPGSFRTNHTSLTSMAAGL